MKTETKTIVIIILIFAIFFLIIRIKKRNEQIKTLLVEQINDKLENIIKIDTFYTWQSVDTVILDSITVPAMPYYRLHFEGSKDKNIRVFIYSVYDSATIVKYELE